MIQQLPKFKGSISDSFQDYLGPYINQLEEELNKYLEGILRDDDVEKNTEFKMLNSSLYLFGFIKKLVMEISSLGKSKVMMMLSVVIKKVLKTYSDELLKQIVKEEKNRGKNEQEFILKICYIVNTSEHCKETIESLCDLINNHLQNLGAECIDMSNEEEQFTLSINRGIEAL